MRFDERVWKLTARVPRGKVTTYRELARAMGNRAYRAVGNALNRNPHAPVVPCHRVVKASGELGGFAGGTATKARMLRQEGITVEHGRIVNFSRALFRF
ncbi:MGMT family protein [Candidatus Woesearchaeota archaeon]|nr:MGMT family protein [Candidatus Woesearchaeota archaeon]